MDLATALWTTKDLSASLEHLPPVAHLLAAAGVVIGLVLWAVGRKILRLVFAALGSLAGGGAGFFLLPTVAPEVIGGFPSPHVGLIVGGLIGVTLGIVLFRFAVGILLAIGMGVAATLIGAAAVQFQPVTDSEALRRDYEALSAPLQMPLPDPTVPEAEPAGEIDPPRERAPPAEPEGPPPPAADQDQLRSMLKAAEPVAERVRLFIQARADEFGEAWGQLSGRQQATVVSAALAGVAAGFILGLLFPAKSSAAATAMVGAAVWMPCLTWLWRAMDAPGAEQLVTLAPALWLAAWVLAAFLGFAIQSVGLVKRRKRE
jgi:hypothetical protein